jgi:hypothetical protein
MNAVRRLAVLAACWLAITANASPARTAWVEEHSEFPFVLRSDARLENGPALLAHLLALQTDVTEQLGIPGSKEWVEVYLFRDQAAFRKFVAAHFPGQENRPALFVKGTGPGMIFLERGDNLAVDLRHETTHALLHAHSSKIPLWLDEGLAEYFEEAPERRAAGETHLAELRERSPTETWPTLQQLERRRQLADFTRADYQSAWSWTHFLLHGPAPLRRELRAYLADPAVGRGERSFAHRLQELDPHLTETQSAHLELLLKQD